MQFALKLHTLFENVMCIILILLMIRLDLNIKENKQCIKKHALFNIFKLFVAATYKRWNGYLC